MESTIQLLQEARAGGYAVPAINVEHTDSLIGVLNVCEIMKSPVIIQLSSLQERARGIGYGPLIRSIKAVAEVYSIPVATHLDHGTDPEDVRLGIESGFSSVMYDGSRLSYEENLKNTAEVKKICGTTALEGELGVVAGTEGTAHEEAAEADIYTDVEQAVSYTQATKVDFLAVAIGNAHGIYRKKPKLNFDRLKELQEAVSIPLVLHGASGLSREDIRTAVELGICKINFFTDVDHAFLAGLRQAMAEDTKAYSFHCFSKARKYVEEQTERIICMCGSMNRAEI